LAQGDVPSKKLARTQGVRSWLVTTELHTHVHACGGMGRKKRTGAEPAAHEEPLGDAGSVADAATAAPAAMASAAAGLALAPPGRPGLPAGGAAATLQTMLQANPQLSAQIAANPLLASQLQQIAQAASAPAALPGVNPDVQELADHFGLDERIAKQLDDEMKTRGDTFDGDLAALWDILETARNPAGLLSVKIKEMQEGTFIGQPKIDKDIKEFQKMYRLDDQATKKLAEVLQNRPATRKEDIELIHKHLETSNKPSARVMMMLGKLRSGEPLGEPDRRIAPGSYLDRMEQERDREKERKADRRSGPDSRRGRSRERERERTGRGRSRSRDRRRSRSRERR